MIEKVENEGLSKIEKVKYEADVPEFFDADSKYRTSFYLTDDLFGREAEKLAEEKTGSEAAK